MRKDRGQALVLLLGLIAALLAATLVAYKAGEVVNHEQRLMNAADAAAFSAASWQARTLNFESYVNRAIVANEAAMAQSVSLRSWSAHVRRTLVHTNVLARYVPYLGQATTFLERLWVGVDRALQPTLLSAETVLAVSDGALAGAQELMHEVAMLHAREVAAAAVAGTDPQMRLTAANDTLFAARALRWRRFAPRHAGAERRRLAGVVEASLDGFTRNRGHTFKPIFGLGLVRLEKRGGTDLLGFETWRGLDTLALHTRRLGLFGGWRERTAIGWGAAEQGRPNRRTGWHGGSLRTNPRASRAGMRSMRAGRAFAGLPAVRDIAVRGPRDGVELDIVVEVAGSRPSITGARGPGGAAVVLGDRIVPPEVRLPHEGLRAVAAAQVYFARPEPRADGRVELPSLYNPYWQARLAPVPRTDRALIAASSGIADPFVALP
jgi:hypothetical protein